jgi:hypothetical protein
LLETRMATERGLQTIDLYQIEATVAPDIHPTSALVAPRYSTVTVFARFRG